MKINLNEGQIVHKESTTATSALTSMNNTPTISDVYDCIIGNAGMVARRALRTKGLLASVVARPSLSQDTAVSQPTLASDEHKRASFSGVR